MAQSSTVVNCQDALTLHLTLDCSLYANGIGSEGAKALSEALKTNSTLQTLGYAAHVHLPTVSTP